MLPVLIGRYSGNASAVSARLNVLPSCCLPQDVEDQATAGLDIMLAEQLAQLSNVTKLYKTQVRSPLQHTDAAQHPVEGREALGVQSKRRLCSIYLSFP